MRLARRVRRAAPLPNSVRTVAVRGEVSSPTGLSWWDGGSAAAPGKGRHEAPRGATASITESVVRTPSPRQPQDDTRRGHADRAVVGLATPPGARLVERGVDHPRPVATPIGAVEGLATPPGVPPVERSWGSPTRPDVRLRRCRRTGW